MAQIMPSASSATGSALGIIGLLYIVRAGTDVSNVDLSMFNPLGWTYLTYPFTENNWIPLFFALVFSIVAEFGGASCRERVGCGGVGEWRSSEAVYVLNLIRVWV